MNDNQTPGIYLIVDFNWPRPITKEVAEKARTLHRVVQGRSWIREAVAASGGIGGKASSIWVFWLEGYGALERLLNDPADEVGQSYNAFFSSMAGVRDKVRGEVIFQSD